MYAVYTSRQPPHQTRTALSERPPQAGSTHWNVIREFADDCSRAQQAAAMADAGHRHPDRMRELYLQSASVPRIHTAHPAFAGADEDTRRMRHAAVVFQLTGMCAVLGLIASIVLTA